MQHAQHPGTPKLVRAGEWLRVFRNAPLASSRVDRQSVLKATFRALSDALYTVVYRGQRMPPVGRGPLPPASGGRISLPGDTGGVPAPPAPLPGDTGGTAPAPPPPPPGG